MDPTQTVTAHDEILRTARELYEREPDWVTFFREILGVKGAVRRAFPTPHQMAEFEQSEAYSEIQQMITQLRKRPALAGSGQEPTQVITVRLPKSLHEALRTEAHLHQTSMNKLCISKLLRFIDEEFVPSDT